ncbi:Hypothetical predicted protein [Paramuricea clavata]|uniref:Uncharacterized protein n=1 Tax=Paramuricea clavata TaxID=317549 RepID=A0A6S7HNA0_PARCT|nr:Hypothetical predicted protein [Paramuricea clavata]
MAASTSAQILPYLDNKCYLHIVDDAKCDIKPLTSKRLETLVKRIEDWKGLYGKQLDIALILERKGLTDFVDINSGLIRLEDDFCQKFTNISIINKARRTLERKGKMEEEPAVPPSKPKMPFLRSKVPKMSQQPHTILPKLCIICKKLTKRTKIKGKWVHESLSKAETSDARNDSVGEKKTNFFSEHKAGYDAFCKIVIKERLEVNCEILRLTKLQQLLLKHIQLEERVHLENIRSDMLRVRLQRDFEQLVFHIPSRRNESTIVYCQNVTAGDIAQQYLPTSQVSSVEDESDENDSSEVLENEIRSSRIDRHQTSQEGSSENTFKELFMSGVYLKNKINNVQPEQSKWPPRSKDLIKTNMVPVELFNHIAHITGAVSDDEYTNVTNDRCVDIAEKQKADPPKSLALGLTVRHMTGSTHLLQILAKFGHCASSDTILSYETALAKYRVSQAGKVPEGFKVGSIPTVVWDNIDFNEETSSGKGTSHHTNGILIQTCEDEATDQPQEVNVPIIKKGVRVFTQAEEYLVPYNRVERVGPRTNVPNIPAHWKDLLSKAKVRDFMFIMARMYGGDDVPGWTGYNIKKYDYAILQTKIHYLPVIEASPTDLNTVNTIIYKSIDMKSVFQVPYIICVFDLAIYAKVQEIRWADQHLQEKLVVRLGEFHACMSFMSVIGKRYGDAGLSDILIEAGVVAEGSLNGVISGHH